MPYVDMSQYEVPEDGPEEQSVDSSFIQRGRSALASRAASAGMTPMEYIAAGYAIVNTPTNAQREAPALPVAPTTPRLPSEQRAGEVGESSVDDVNLPAAPDQDSAPEERAYTSEEIDLLHEEAVKDMDDGDFYQSWRPPPRSKSRIQEYFDSGKAGEHFMEGVGDYYGATTATKRLPVQQVAPELADNIPVEGEIVPKPPSVTDTPNSDIIDAEVVEDF